MIKKEYKISSSIPLKELQDPPGFENFNKKIKSMENDLNLTGKKNFKKTVKKNNKKKISNAKKKVICCNCGKPGHIYKRCYHPVTSIGIICFRMNEENEKEFLLIRRKDSLAFSEFLKVKFDVNNRKQIEELLSDITIDEKKFLSHAKTPLEIWKHLWKVCKKNKMNEFNKIEKKLSLLMKGVKDKNGNFFNLNSILDNIKNLRSEPEWGFPKGRKLPKESDIKCAMREFSEETDIQKSKIIVLKIKPLQELFIGSNKVKYKHIYYIAKVVDNNLKLKVNENNKNQFSEISDIKWFSIDETILKLEEKNIERIKLFKELIQLLDFLKIN